jgi:hypothetical protein
MTANDELIQRRLETFDRNQPQDRRNPHDKVTFDELIARASTTPTPK